MEKKYKTFWPRFWAGWVDTIVFIPFMLLSFYIDKNWSAIPIWIYASWNAFYSLLWYGYSIYFHGRFGQTIGKMACKVRVMDVSEASHIGFKQAFLRDIVPLSLVVLFLPYQTMQILNKTSYLINKDTMPDVLTMIYIYSGTGWVMLEFITMLLNSKRRAIHDFLARSVVVRL